jgi:hypothetical protein
MALAVAEGGLSEYGPPSTLSAAALLKLAALQRTKMNAEALTTSVAELVFFDPQGSPGYLRWHLWRNYYRKMTHRRAE